MPASASTKVLTKNFLCLNTAPPRRLNCPVINKPTFGRTLSGNIFVFGLDFFQAGGKKKIIVSYFNFERCGY